MIDPTLVARVALPVALAAFGLFALAWPALRLWRRTGRFAFTALSSPDPVERAMGAGFAAGCLALGGWAVACALLGPGPLGVWSAPRAVTWTGLAALGLGFAVVVVSQAQMGASWRVGISDEPTGLVTHGLYAWIRNPIYTGLYLQLAGLVLVTPAPATLAGAATLVALVAWQTRREERHLERLHGAEFRAWAARTGRFFPGIGRRPAD